MRSIVEASDFLKDNYLSNELRVPITLLGINACSPLATNAIRGNIWDNFSSESHKQLPSVGTIKIRHPVTGKEMRLSAAGRRPRLHPAGVAGQRVVDRAVPAEQRVGPFETQPFDTDVSVRTRMKVFQDSIEQMLWPERRAKDPLFANETGPGIGVIDRITVDSYLDVAEGYIPEASPRRSSDAGHRLFPFIGGSDYSVKIGPFPKGMPIGLLTNIDILGSELSPEEQAPAQGTAAQPVQRAKHELKSGADIATTLGGLVDDMLAAQQVQGPRRQQGPLLRHEPVRSTAAGRSGRRARR